jgi:hypothetical protein
MCQARLAHSTPKLRIGGKTIDFLLFSCYKMNEHHSFKG